jgi:mannose-1-phosphate guanylyltransferase
MKRVAVIMAGGSGERFWPLSRKNKPKQLLNLISDKTLLRESIDRIAKAINLSDIYIITGHHLVEPIRENLPELPPGNVIAEPAKRNTAPALAYAAAFIWQKYSKEFIENEILLGILTADQLISPINGFVETIDRAFEYVEEGDVLLTLGIKPSRPETGYGYIEIEGNLNKEGVLEAMEFHEKPNAETAQKYLRDGNYYWNSGMFFWRLDIFRRSMVEFMPEIGKKMLDLKNALDEYETYLDNDGYDKINQIFSSFPSESIDFGLMEKADNVYIMKADFDWDDVGSWDSLDRVNKRDSDGNVIKGNVSMVDTKDTIIINKSGDDILVTASGVDDLVIITTPDSVLVTRKDKVQNIKSLVAEIKQSGKEKWL